MYTIYTTHRIYESCHIANSHHFFSGRNLIQSLKQVVHHNITKKMHYQVATLLRSNSILRHLTIHLQKLNIKIIKQFHDTV